MEVEIDFNLPQYDSLLDGHFILDVLSLYIHMYTQLINKGKSVCGC